MPPPDLSPPPVPPSHGAYPPRPGNALRPWVDGVPFYTRLLDAFERAHSRVWFVVSFIHRDFRFPGGQPLWDVLDRCAARGVDVRLLCWRNPSFFMPKNLLQGDPADLEFLARRRAPWKLRWDSSAPDPDHCHHQKLWVVDAGTPDEVGFAGGMTWGNSTLDRPAHDLQPHSRHDACVELRGPCVTDLAHSFIERWNQARSDPAGPPRWPSDEGCPDLPYPAQLAVPHAGDVTAQVSRTLQPGRYRQQAPPPGAPPFDPHAGESGIFYQYLAAIRAARRSVYLENQHPGEAHLLGALEDATARGVEVLLVVPGEPMAAIAREKEDVRSFHRSGRQGPAPRYLAEFEALGRLATSPRFTLASLARAAGPDAEIYTHAKLCVVDGQWLTCGSANLVDLSLHADHSELNVSAWSPAVARGLLAELLAEHTGAPPDPGERDEAAWLRQARAVALDNARRRGEGLPPRGHLHALDAANYPAPR